MKKIINAVKLYDEIISESGLKTYRIKMIKSKNPGDAHRVFLFGYYSVSHPVRDSISAFDVAMAI